jgi:hypothetical protein
MLVAAFVYLAAGLIMRIRRGNERWYLFALLGVVLAMAYLSKAAMFPLAFVFLIVGLLSAPRWTSVLPKVLIALFSFSLIALPFIIALSLKVDRLTIGDSGRLNYAWYVNGLTFAHWQGEIPGGGVPEYPSRVVLARPHVYEFSGLEEGTYPISYNRAHWYEGARLHFDPIEQANVLLANFLFYYDLFIRDQGGLLAGVLLLLMLAAGQRWRPDQIGRRWGLLIIAISAFVMYGLVYVETRYLGAFVVLFWTDLMANVGLQDLQMNRKVISFASIVMLVTLLINLLAFNLDGYRNLRNGEVTVPSTGSQAELPGWPGEVAEELHRLGVQQGEQVAVVGYAFDSYWARLARVQIVAELPGSEADLFWLGDVETKANVMQAFARSGVGAIVAEYVPVNAEPEGWNQVGNSNFFVYLLEGTGD